MADNPHSFMDLDAIIGYRFFNDFMSFPKENLYECYLGQK